MRRRWTKEELEMIRRWQCEGIPGPEQAKRLGRSYRSWGGAVARSSLSGGHCKGRGNRNCELRLAVIDGIGRGWSLPRIGRWVNRCNRRVQTIVRELLDDGLVEKSGYHGPYKVGERWKK